MARVTVEDCIDKVSDRFELVAVAAERAKNIAKGDAITIERNGEKNTVIALREIANGNIEVPKLRDLIINKNSSSVLFADDEEEEFDLEDFSEEAFADLSSETKKAPAVEEDDDIEDDNELYLSDENIEIED